MPIIYCDCSSNSHFYSHEFITPMVGIGVAGSIGSRNYMEDSCIITNYSLCDDKVSDTPLSFSASLVDGHGGNDVSDFTIGVIHSPKCRGDGECDCPIKSSETAPNIHSEVEKYIGSCNTPSVQRGITKAYNSFDHLIYDSISTKRITDSGAVLCSLFMTKDGMVHFANCGDCETIFVGNDPEMTMVNTSIPHRPSTNKDEIKRLAEDGYVTYMGRVGGVLSISRAFGDFSFKKVDPVTEIHDPKSAVISTPHVCSHHSANIKFAIMGTDGLWDFTSKDKAVGFVSRKISMGIPLDEIAASLINYVLSDTHNVIRGVTCNHDNITVGIVVFRDSSPNYFNGSADRSPPINEKTSLSFNTKTKNLSTAVINCDRESGDGWRGLGGGSDEDSSKGQIFI